MAYRVTRFVNKKKTDVLETTFKRNVISWVKDFLKEDNKALFLFEDTGNGKTIVLNNKNFDSFLNYFKPEEN